MTTPDLERSKSRTDCGLGRFMYMTPCRMGNCSQPIKRQNDILAHIFVPSSHLHLFRRSNIISTTTTVLWSTTALMKDLASSKRNKNSFILPGAICFVILLSWARGNENGFFLLRRGGESRRTSRVLVASNEVMEYPALVLRRKMTTQATPKTKCGDEAKLSQIVSNMHKFDAHCSREDTDNASS